MDKLDEGSGNQLLGGVTESLLEGRIDLLEVTVAAGDTEHLQRGLEESDDLRLRRGVSPIVLSGNPWWPGVCIHHNHRHEGEQTKPVGGESPRRVWRLLAAPKRGMRGNAR